MRSYLRLLVSLVNKLRYRLVDPERHESYCNTLEQIEWHESPQDECPFIFYEGVYRKTHIDDALCRESEDASIQGKCHEIVQRDSGKREGSRRTEHRDYRALSRSDFVVDHSGAENVDASREEVGHLADTGCCGYGKMDKVLQKLDDNAVNRT